MSDPAAKWIVGWIGNRAPPSLLPTRFIPRHSARLVAVNCRN